MLFRTKATGLSVILFLLCFTMLNVQLFVVHANSLIIHIKEDGAIEGTDKIHRNGDLYTLTSDINSSVPKGSAFIFIETHNIVIDGAGHTIKGNGTGTAISMLRRQNVTIKNCNIEGFDNGLHFWVVNNFPADSQYWGLPNARDNKILNNNITVTGTVKGEDEGSSWAIFLRFEADHNIILGNTITCDDPNGGIYDDSFNNTFVDNKFVGCGLHLSSSSQSSGINNTIDGVPCRILNGAVNQVIDGAGQVFLFNCNNMSVRNVQPPYSQIIAIQLSDTKNSIVTNCEGEIILVDSYENSVFENSAKLITISKSSYNKVFKNTVVDSGVCMELNGWSGYNEVYENILLNSKNSSDADSRHYLEKNAVGLQLGTSQQSGCHHTLVYGNLLVNHDVALESYGSSNNNLYSNNIVDSNIGIMLLDCDFNTVYQNNITDCNEAVNIRGSNNTFYGNNFVDNANQVTITHQTLFSSNIITKYSTNNTFDSGPILGGNFWSPYNGTDVDNDGIGDTAYIIKGALQDNYPLMAPFDLDLIPEFPAGTFLLVMLFSFVVVFAVYRFKINMSIKDELK